MKDENGQLLKALKGKVLKEFTGVRFILDVGEPCDYLFTYCLCCYMLIEGLDKPLKITSVETDTGYTVFVESISVFEYENRCYGLSGNMFIEPFEAYKDLQIEGYRESSDGDDLLGFHLSFDNGMELHIVSGEHYKTDDGYGVSGPDEMLLIFQKESDIKHYGLMS